MTRRRIQFAGLLVGLLMMGLRMTTAVVLAAEIIDRIVVTVDGIPITQSEWDDAVHFEALVEGRAPEAITEADRKATLDRLVDQALIEQQIRQVHFDPASAEQVAARVAEVRSQIAAGANDATWRAALARYSLSEEDVAQRVRVQMDESHFVDEHFRPTVQVGRREVERYYNDDFVPQVRKAGGEPRPLAEVETQIEQILTEQRVSALLGTWLQTLRTQIRIQFHESAAAPAGTLPTPPPGGMAR